MVIGIYMMLPVFCYQKEIRVEFPVVSAHPSSVAPMVTRILCGELYVQGLPAVPLDCRLRSRRSVCPLHTEILPLVLLLPRSA